MARGARSVAGAHRGRHFRLSDGLCLHSETYQTVAGWRYPGVVYLGRKERLSSSASFDPPRHGRIMYILDHGADGRVCRGQSIGLLVVSLCIAGAGGYLGGRDNAAVGEFLGYVDHGVHGVR